MKLAHKLSDHVTRFDALPWPTRLGLRIVALALGLAIFVPLFWNILGWGPAERSAQPLYDKLEREGTPLSAAGFTKMISVPAEENCAPELQVALLSLSERIKKLSRVNRAAIQNQKTFLADSGELPVPAGQVKVALSLVEAELRAAKATIKKDRFVPPHDWSDPLNVYFEEFARMRELTKTLSLSATYHASVGNHERAVEDIRAGSKVAYLCGDGPWLIGQLVSIACHAITHAGIKKCIQADPAHATEYAAGLDEKLIWPTGRFFRGEAYIAMASSRNLGVRDLRAFVESQWITDDLPEEPELERQRRSRTSGLPSDPIIRAMVARILHRYDLVLSTVDKGGFEKSPGALRNVLKQIGDDYSDDIRDFLLNNISIWGTASLDGEERCRADLRVTKALAKVVAFNRSQGRWPKSLVEAGVSLKDPFGGEPLRFRVSAGDVRVWSLGSDRQDNNGITQQEANIIPGGPPFDVVAVYTFSTQHKVPTW